LDERVTDRVLYDILIQAGRVVDLYIPRDRDTDKPKGYAFAEYETEEIAEYAVKLFSGLVTLYNRTLKFAVCPLFSHPFLSFLLYYRWIRTYVVWNASLCVAMLLCVVGIIKGVITFPDLIVFVELTASLFNDRMIRELAIWYSISNRVAKLLVVKVTFI